MIRTRLSLMLGVNACGYAIIPFRVTHSRKGATDLLNKQYRKKHRKRSILSTIFLQFQFITCYIIHKVLLSIGTNGFSNSCDDKIHRELGLDGNVYS